MIFNSLIFIFCFLPLTLLLYYFIPVTTIKNIILLIASLLFYSWADPASLVILLALIGWNYVSGYQLEKEEDEKKRKIILWVSIGLNLVILCIYKYMGLSMLKVPMGLSFFTFSAISYLADIYTKKSVWSKNPLSFALYISFFGKISMGPVVQYNYMESQLDQREISKDKLASGTMLFIKGLVKKVLISDQFAVMFSMLENNTSVFGTWLFAISYMFQLYFDFSGYSDMAIGIGKMFGFEIPINFNHPYVAKSIQDFWRRWHISLSQWFRDYLYIPLGGSRVDNKTYIRNILIVWLATGLWHGANFTFIVWGLYYAAFLLLEKFYLKDKLQSLPNFISRIYTLLVVLIGWIFFFSPSILDAFKTLGMMVAVGSTSIIDNSALYVLTSNIFLIILGIILSTPIYGRVQIVLYNTLKSRSIVLTSTIYIICFVLCIAFIVGGTYQSFLYFAF